MKREWLVVDRNGVPVAEPFATERKAYEAMSVYRDHCTDIALPMRVIAKGLSDDVENDRFVPFDESSSVSSSEVTGEQSK